MNEEVRKRGDVEAVGIPEPTSACVLPDTPNDGRPLQTWISIEGLRVLGDLVRQLQSRGERPECAAPDEAGEPGGRAPGRRQRPAGADRGAGAAGRKGARSMTRADGDDR